MDLCQEKVLHQAQVAQAIENVPDAGAAPGGFA